MARGLAGNEVLESLIQGALIFWLSTYAMIAMAHLVNLITHPADPPVNCVRHYLKILKNAIPPMVFTSGGITLLVTNEKTILLLTCFTILLTITLIGWLTIKLRQDNPRCADTGPTL